MACSIFFSLIPVLLDGPPHGKDPLPLLGVGGVVVAGHGLDQAQDAGGGAGVAQVGAVEVTVLDHHHRGSRAGQLSRRPVTTQLLINLKSMEKEKKKQLIICNKSHLERRYLHL